jgi:hypothetical protein
MCQTRIALGIEHRGIDGPAGVGVPGSEVWIAAAVSDGRVNDLNLVNKWITPSVETDATLAGIGVGRTYAGVYQSEILTEGERGGAYGLLFPASNQTWMHVALVVGTDAGPGEQLQVAVWFLDLMPNGCHLRSASERTDVDCPRVHEFLP